MGNKKHTKIESKLRAENDMLRKRVEELDKWRTDIEFMMPGGSEYHNNRKKCIKYIEDISMRQAELTKKFVKERNNAVSVLDEVRAKIEELQEDAVSEEVHDTCQSMLDIIDR